MEMWFTYMYCSLQRAPRPRLFLFFNFTKPFFFLIFCSSVCLADGISRRPFGLFFFLVSFPFCFVSSLFHFVLLVITYKPRGFFCFVLFACLFGEARDPVSLAWLPGTTSRASREGENSAGR